MRCVFFPETKSCISYTYRVWWLTPRQKALLAISQSIERRYIYLLAFEIHRRVHWFVNRRRRRRVWGEAREDCESFKSEKNLAFSFLMCFQFSSSLHFTSAASDFTARSPHSSLSLRCFISSPVLLLVCSSHPPKSYISLVVCRLNPGKWAYNGVGTRV